MSSRPAVKYLPPTVEEFSQVWPGSSVAPTGGAALDLQLDLRRVLNLVVVRVGIGGHGAIVDEDYLDDVTLEQWVPTAWLGALEK